MSTSVELATAVALVREQLAEDPALIEQLAPGMILVPRPMTPQERAKLAVPAMNAARREARQRRLLAGAEAIRELVKENPAIMNEEIVRHLNKRDLPSPAGRPWLLPDVVRLRKDLDLAH